MHPSSLPRKKGNCSYLFVGTVEDQFPSLPLFKAQTGPLPRTDPPQVQLLAADADYTTPLSCFRYFRERVLVVLSFPPGSFAEGFIAFLPPTNQFLSAILARKFGVSIMNCSEDCAPFLQAVEGIKILKFLGLGDWSWMVYCPNISPPLFDLVVCLLLESSGTPPRPHPPPFYFYRTFLSKGISCSPCAGFFYSVVSISVTPPPPFIRRHLSPWSSCPC